MAAPDAGHVALVSEPSGDDGGSGAGLPDGGSGNRGDVRGESANRLPPVLGGDAAEPGGVSLAIGIALIVLALALGFATPHLRARLRSP
jgi:hypothetical protein